MDTLRQVSEAALKLPPEARAELAERLVESIEDWDEADDGLDELAAAALRRAEALDRGEMTASDWKDSIERMRRELERRIGREAQG